MTQEAGNTYANLRIRLGFSAAGVHSQARYQFGPAGPA